MSWFGVPSLRDKGNALSQTVPKQDPPQWTPAPEESHDLGLYGDATDEEYNSAREFCAQHPLEAPKLLPSDVVAKINAEGNNAWSMEWPRSQRFVGRVQEGGEKGKPAVTKVVTYAKCQDVCLFSNLPILAGLYEIQGKTGIYYEVRINKMRGIVAIGTACRPYPDWRFPGWNRASAGLHLDDMRKFFQDPDGGRDYDEPSLQHFSADGDFIGCGYEFEGSRIFYTYNGQRLADAFGGVYVPRIRYDVYAAIGVEGECEFEVNFGGEPFKWKEGNEWAWRVEGHVGRLSATSSSSDPGLDIDDELPTYEEAQKRQRSA